MQISINLKSQITKDKKQINYILQKTKSKFNYFFCFSTIFCV